MSQTAKIIGATLIMFGLYVTLKGEAATYVSFFWGTNASKAS